jgi:hypothetical protein
VFSRRVPASLEPGPWARRLAALRAAGTPLIDLAEHNPTTAGLGHVTPEALAPLAAAVAAAEPYAPDPAGLRAAREAIAADYARRGFAVDPGRVVLTAGTSEAYAHAFRLLADPGDVVLVPRPSYPLFEPLAHAEGCGVAQYPLREDAGAWRLDPWDLEAAFASAGGRARAVVVVQPNHPTGSCLDRAEADAMAEFCARHDLALLADEVFGDFLRDPAEPGARPHGSLRRSFVDEERALTLVFSGLSKAAGLPQLKLGWIAVSGPAGQARAAQERLEWLADTFLTVASPVQRALPELLAARGTFVAAARERTTANRAALAAAASRIAGARVLPTDGGWSSVLELPAVRSDEEWALALLEHDVVVHPGYFYEFAGPGCVVLSLLPPPDRFAEALARIEAVAR